MLSVFWDKTKNIRLCKAINILCTYITIMELQLTNIWWFCLISLALDRTMRAEPCWLVRSWLITDKNAAITQIVQPKLHSSPNNTQQRRILDTLMVTKAWTSLSLCPSLNYDIHVYCMLCICNMYVRPLLINNFSRASCCHDMSVPVLCQCQKPHLFFESQAISTN